MIALASLVVAAAGCTPGASNRGPNTGPYHEWFNPDGQKVSERRPEVCPTGEVPGLPEVIPPLTVPPVVGEGYSFAKIDLRVEALIVKSDGPDPVRALCIPVAVHAFITVGGVNAPITTADLGVVPTPWDALRNTPYEVTGILAWKTTLVSAPVVNINWSAKYEAVIDPVDRGNMVVGLACTVFVNGAPYARTISLDVDRETAPLPGAQGEQAVTGPFVQCAPPAFTPRAAL